MRIPESKIDDVRNATDIVDLISSSVKLKRRGKNFLGLCPFHQERTPSFTVSPERQMYHCFGCGAGGNAFTFVMEMEKVSFVEAARTLADRAGIALPDEGPIDQAKVTEEEELYAVCRLAARYYHGNLTGTVEGKLALEYFHHRGFSDETIRKFGLGYAMNAWDGVVKVGEREKIEPVLLEKAGLIVRREDSAGYYDRFRGRAMFPILSVSGRTIAFGARKMREDDPLAKYINSPETPIYNKRRTLYGLYQSKDAIRSKEQAILVEGYADLISVFQAGIENVVASSGTALTEEQIELVGRYAKGITLVYDADSAGSKATMRGLDLIIGMGLEVRVAELPEGEDPDSFVKKNGGPAFEKLVADAVSFVDFKAKTFQSQGFFNTPDGQTRAVRSIVDTIARIDDELKRNFYIKHVAQRYGVYESVLFRELEKQLGHVRSRPRSDVKPDEGTTTPQRDGGGASPQSVVVNVPTAERELLRLMFEYGEEMVSYVFSHIDEGLLTHPHVRHIVRCILDHVETGEPWDASSLLDGVQDADLRRFIADTVFSKYEISKGWTKIGEEPEVDDPHKSADSSIRVLRIQEIEKQIAENVKMLKQAEARGDSVLPYQQQIMALQQQRKELQTHRTVP